MEDFIIFSLNYVDYTLKMENIQKVTFITRAPKDKHNTPLQSGLSTHTQMFENLYIVVTNVLVVS